MESGPDETVEGACAPDAGEIRRPGTSMSFSVLLRNLPKKAAFRFDKADFPMDIPHCHTSTLFSPDLLSTRMTKKFSLLLNIARVGRILPNVVWLLFPFDIKHTKKCRRKMRKTKLSKLRLRRSVVYRLPHPMWIASERSTDETICWEARKKRGRSRDESHR